MIPCKDFRCEKEHDGICVLNNKECILEECSNYGYWQNCINNS